MGRLCGRSERDALRADAGWDDLPDLLFDRACVPASAAPDRATALARGEGVQWAAPTPCRVCGLCGERSSPRQGGPPKLRRAGSAWTKTIAWADRALLIRQKH